MKKIKNYITPLHKSAKRDSLDRMMNEISKWKDALILTSKSIKKVNQNLLNFKKILIL